MLNLLTERRLAQLFHMIGSREQEIERARIALCQNSAFELYTAFRYLDSNVRGSISSVDILNFLTRHSIASDLRNIQLLISEYDSNLDGRLSLDEFSQFTLPSTNQLLRESVSFRTPYSNLALEAQYLLLRLIELELSFIQDSEKLRCEITIQGDFSLLDSFRVIDSTRNSFINRESLRSLLLRNGLYLNETDIDGVFRRLDSDDDGLLNYVEYVDAVMPKRSMSSPSKSLASRVSENSPSRYSYVSFQHSSPDRHASPLRQASPLRKSLLQREPSPPRQSSFSSTFFRKASPVRLSPAKISPSRASPSRTSPLRSSPARQSYHSALSSYQAPRASSPLRRSSPLRQSPLRPSNEAIASNGVASIYEIRSSPARTLNCYDVSPTRKSSPLRSPQKSAQFTDNSKVTLQYSSSFGRSKFSPLKSVDLTPGSPYRRSPNSFMRTGEDIIPRRIDSPLRSAPLRNTPLRESISDSPYRSSPSKNNY